MMDFDFKIVTPEDEKDALESLFPSTVASKHKSENESNIPEILEMSVRLPADGDYYKMLEIFYDQLVKNKYGKILLNGLKKIWFSKGGKLLEPHEFSNVSLKLLGDGDIRVFLFY
jgi:hypothetical protein